MIASMNRMKWAMRLLLLFIMAGCTFGGSSDQIAPTTMQPTTILIADPTTSPVVMRVGYCPTMQSELSSLPLKDVDLQQISFPSAAHALQALQLGEVDMALVGRKPIQAELGTGLLFKQLWDGVTLTASQKMIIPFADLASFTIYTSLPPDEVGGLFPSGTQLIYIFGSELPDFAADESAHLIRWSQFQDHDQLLIPVDGLGNKIPAFRSPFLVYPASNATLFEEIPIQILSGASK